MSLSAKLLTILTLILILLLSACGGETEETVVPDNNSQSVVENPVENPPGLVAIVNGEEIAEEQFGRELARRQQESAVADPDALASMVLNTLIEQTLIRQAAVDMQITVGDEELDAELQLQIDAANLAGGWSQWLENNLYTEDEFREALRNSLVTGRVIERITQNLSGDVAQVHARHILLQTRDEANSVLARLNAGEDFTELATTVSVAAEAEFGGDLGWFTRQGLLETTLAEVAFSLQPGEIAGPVPTRLGYHIIQTLEFAELPVEPEARANLAQIQFENWLQSLLESAAVERF